MALDIHKVRKIVATDEADGDESDRRYRAPALEKGLDILELLATANDLFAMVSSGKVKIEISNTYDLHDAPRAHADMEARKTTGSIVLVV